MRSIFINAFRRLAAEPKARGHYIIRRKKNAYIYNCQKKFKEKLFLLRSLPAVRLFRRIHIFRLYLFFQKSGDVGKNLILRAGGIHVQGNLHLSHGICTVLYDIL